jgi:hypothetical protein
MFSEKSRRSANGSRRVDKPAVVASLFQQREVAMGLFDRFTAKGRRDEFAKRVMQHMTEKGWPHPMRYIPERWKIDFGGPAGELMLEPMHDAFLSYPKNERGSALDRSIAFIFDMGPPPPWEEARAKLMPIVRPRVVADAMERTPNDGTGPEEPPPWRALSDHLVVHLAVDRPSSTLVVEPQMLRDWGVTFDEGYNVAMGNLARRELPSLEQHEDGFFATEEDEYYDLSRLLLPDSIAALPLKGAPVVIPAIRRRILVAGSEDAAAVEAMARIAHYLISEKQGFPVSYAPLVLEGDQWRPYDPPQGLGTANALTALQACLDFETEYPLLNGRLRRTERAEELAGLTILPDENDVPQTLALWVEAASLLPKADLIVMRAPTGTIVRRWEDVDAAFGGLPREPDTALTYAVVSDWPSGDVMAGIEAAWEPEWARGRGIGVVNGRLSIFG